MKHQEAISLSKELRKKITRYSQYCEVIKVVDIGTTSRIEILPKKGTETISNIKEICEFIMFFDLNSYIDVNDDGPRVNIF